MYILYSTGNSVTLLSTKKEAGKKIGGATLDLPKIRRNPLIEIIAINTGSVYLLCAILLLLTRGQYIYYGLYYCY